MNLSERAQIIANGMAHSVYIIRVDLENCSTARGFQFADFVEIYTSTDFFSIKINPPFSMNKSVISAIASLLYTVQSIHCMTI